MRSTKAALALAAALTALLIPQTAGAAGECQYNGELYSEGASVCECPKVYTTDVLIGRSSTEGKIVGNRLICQDSAWQAGADNCIDIRFGSSGDLKMLIGEISRDYCPAGGRQLGSISIN